MPRDDLAWRLRRALEPQQQEFTAAATSDPAEVQPNTPLRQLHRLAAYGESESVRLQAVRILLEREEAGRRRRADVDGDYEDEEAPTIRGIVSRMTAAEVEREWDLLCGDEAVAQALAGDSKYPRLAAAIQAAAVKQADARVRELLDPEDRE